VRQIVRRTHTQLGGFMLPALATLVAPHAVAEWEFVEMHKPSDKIAHIDPSAMMNGYQCLGCGDIFWPGAPLEVDALPICLQCRTDSEARA